tara:strand:- start:174 stop:422 length:249 start_codon:yes stop_codon:yes gene_type:complete
MKQSNQTLVLRALAYSNTVTHLTMLNAGIKNLPDAIMRLRRKDWAIRSLIKTDMRGDTYCSYKLVEAQRDEARLRVSTGVAA